MPTSSPGPAEAPRRFRDIASDRLALTELSESGLREMAEYSRDARLYEHLEFPPHRSFEETREYYEKLRRRMADGAAHYWYIRALDTGKVIGTFGFHSVDWRVGRAEIGYGLSPAEWGKGYFGEALHAALDFAFGELGLHRVAAVTLVSNTGSLRALERAGFAREGTMRDYYLAHDGRRGDAAIFAILATDWISKGTKEKRRQ